MMSGRKLMDLAGWEAFVHGVFAITITLLVLDISVPAVDATPNGAALVAALLARAPEYGAYLLSFMYVGAYWIGTHRSLRLVGEVDHRFLVIGLLYLMSIAVVPFVSSLLAEYIASDQGRDQVVVIVFIGWQFVVSLLAYGSLLYSSRAGLLNASVDPADARRWLLLAGVATVVWLAAVIAAFFVGVVALVFPVALLPMYLYGGAARSEALR